ncbi:MAG: hypothetical protein R6X12_01045 [bacterium]
MLALGLAWPAAATVTFERLYEPSPHTNNNWHYTVECLPDGGYLLPVCLTGMPDSTLAGWLRLDSLGDLVWARGYEPLRLAGGRTSGACRTRDGCYVVAGDCGGPSPGNLMAIKADSAGNHVWTWLRVRPALERLDAICATPDSGVLVGGKLFEHGWYGMGVVKLDKDGRQEWANVYRDEYSMVSTAQLTHDGGFILNGLGTGGGRSACLVRINSYGSIIWTRMFAGYGENTSGFAARQTHDLGFVQCGGTGGFGSGGETIGGGFVLKLDSAGNEQWHRYISPTVSSDTAYWFHSIVQTPDRGYAIAALLSPYRASPWMPVIHLLRLDSLGELLWTREFDGLRGRARPDWIENTPDGGFILAGNADFWYTYLIKTDSLGRVAVGLEEDRPVVRATRPTLDVRPNPARDRVRLAGTEGAGLYAPDGRRVAVLTPGENDVRQLARGVYFILRQDTGESARLVLVQ